MPLKKGSSNKTRSKNISEFHSGKTYAKTKKKHGKKTADKQAIAAAYALKRKSNGCRAQIRHHYSNQHENNTR